MMENHSMIATNSDSAVQSEAWQEHDPAKRENLSSSDLYRRLRNDILRCQLRPGARLLFRTLRADYKAGLSQLREALMRLASEDLVVLESNKGFRVAPVSPEELLDITNVRCEVEAIALRMAIEKGDVRWESSIVARQHELSRVTLLNPEGAFSDEWNAANEGLHAALRAACGSPLLLAFCESLSERYYRYRRLWARHPSNLRNPAHEHEDIVNAVIARQADKAVPLLKKHLTATTQDLLAHWSTIVQG
jgi:GntR family transcriptional regulator, carbon starvation induced regulator